MGAKGRWTWGFALAAAFSNALNVVSQHAASTAATATAKGWRLAFCLVRQPLWLLGVAAMIGGFAFQALALYHGKLSVVQPLLVSVILGVWLFGGHFTNRSRSRSVRWPF